MIWVIIALAVIVVILSVALYFQIKGSRDQATEQETLLRDYQRRVDEQQQLLEDYRALEKNFNNVGEGYEQALDLYDKIEENSRKLEERNAFLEKQNKDLQSANAQHEETSRTNKDYFQKIVQEMGQEADKLDITAAGKLIGLVHKIQDMLEIDNEEALSRDDNVVAEQIVWI